MNYKLHFQLLDKMGLEKENGSASAFLDEENLTITPQSRMPFLISYRNITAINPQEFAVELDIGSNSKLLLSKFGRLFDPFYKNLVTFRNEIILQDLLMYESLRQSGYEADVTFIVDAEQETFLQRCELRLYETALVVLPESGELLRIPYSEIIDIKEENHTLELRTDFDEHLILSKMGRQYEPFMRELNAAADDLTLKVQAMLKELMPLQNPLVIRQTAGLLKEGKAVKRGDLEAMIPGMWSELEKKLEIVGIKSEFDFLWPYSAKDRVAIGIKRGLMGDLTGEYIWFLMPIYAIEDHAGKNIGGNAIAVEAGSTENSGKATYFFRITGRNLYRELGSPESLDPDADKFIKEYNRCMVLINFRREPIYLTDEQLNEPRYEKYKYAVNKIPALQLLRKNFIGRVFHHSPQQWSEDVLSLLKYNVECKDDDSKWSKESRS